VIDHDELALAGVDRDPQFLELAEQIAERLQSGEEVDAGDFVQQYPQWAGAIRMLLPTMNDLAGYGRAIDRDRRHGHQSYRPNSDKLS
jgi:hypothetical protein